MIEEAAIEESDEDEDADLSDNTVEGRIQCKSDMITLCGDLCTIVTSGDGILVIFCYTGLFYDSLCKPLPQVTKVW